MHKIKNKFLKVITKFLWLQNLNEPIYYDWPCV
jgi:hypothetical protein